MKREFTRRENVLLLILTVLLLFTGYMKLFSAPLNARLEAARDRLADAESTLTVEQAKLSQKEQMEAQLDKLKQSGSAQTAEIPDYNNIDQVMIRLGAILGAAKSYGLTFSDLQYADSLVIRPIKMTFTAGNYTAARKILTNLDQCGYRCTLSDLTVASDGQDVSADPVNVSLTVTFYEKDASGTARVAVSQNAASSAAS